MFIGPASCHAPHHCQSIFRCGAPVFNRLGLANLELRMLTAFPMDGQHHVAHLIIDIDNNVGDQCT
jgi:hypothetical protein